MAVVVIEMIGVLNVARAPLRSKPLRAAADIPDWAYALDHRGQVASFGWAF